MQSTHFTQQEPLWLLIQHNVCYQIKENVLKISLSTQKYSSKIDVLCSIALSNVFKLQFMDNCTECSA